MTNKPHIVIMEGENIGANRSNRNHERFLTQKGEFSAQQAGRNSSFSQYEIEDSEPGGPQTKAQMQLKKE